MKDQSGPPFLPDAKTLSYEPEAVINSGDLLAWSYDGLKGYYRYLNQFIQLVTMSSYSHVGIAVIIEGEILVLEATQPMIQMTPIKKKGHFYFIPMHAPNANKLSELIHLYIGKRYSVWDCIRAYFGWTVTDNNRYQCAELCTEVYEHLGLNIKPDRITPQGLVRAALIKTKSGLFYF